MRAVCSVAWLVVGVGWALGLEIRAETVPTAEPANDTRAVVADWDVPRMAAQIDRRIESKLAAQGIVAGPLSDDAEFFRRVHLDLIGVLPQPAEARAFLADLRPDKRAEVIERLLASPRHATHLANTWRQFLLPGVPGPEQIANVAGLQNWLRQQFAENLRYDRIVGDLLVATGGGSAGPALYFTALDLVPEKLAASTARNFLGLRIECAQCHQHPFDRWTQADFWGYAAFFARLRRSDAMPGLQRVELVDAESGEVFLPDTQTVVLPKFLDNMPLDPDAAADTRRIQLAIWIASRDNPYLARAAVNRVWAHLFGRGLVEPVDDLGPHHPPSHPELMDELTEWLIARQYNLRDLFRAIAGSQAYQRTSRVAADHGSSLDHYGVMAIKTLTAEQLYDCLERLVRRPMQVSEPFAFGEAAQFDPRRLNFAARMRMQGNSARDFEAGVLQALTLLNGDDTANSTNRQTSGLLIALEAPWLTDDERLDTLFLATLSRFPDPTERNAFHALRTSLAATDQQEAWSDLLWALVNSAEFQLNH